jgi:hypothetical protein
VNVLAKYHCSISTSGDGQSKPTAKMNSGSWIARLQGVDFVVLEGLCFSNCVAILSLDF